MDTKPKIVFFDNPSMLWTWMEVTVNEQPFGVISESGSGKYKLFHPYITLEEEELYHDMEEKVRECINNLHKIFNNEQ